MLISAPNLRQALFSPGCPACLSLRFDLGMHEADLELGLKLGQDLEPPLSAGRAWAPGDTEMASDHFDAFDLQAVREDIQQGRGVEGAPLCRIGRVSEVRDDRDRRARLGDPHDLPEGLLRVSRPLERRVDQDTVAAIVREVEAVGGIRPRPQLERRTARVRGEPLQTLVARGHFLRLNPMRLGRRRGPVRVLSLGYLPPEMGGSDRGGIATFHGVLLEEFARRRDLSVDVTGVFVSPPDELDEQRAAACPAPILGHRQPQRPGRRYKRLLQRARPQVVVFNHITNLYLTRWAKLHRRLAPSVPAIGIAHSWHPITRHEGDEAERRKDIAREGIAAVDVLCLGSDHARAEGGRLGIDVPATSKVIPYPLQHAYAEIAEVDDRPRNGVVFLGSLMRRKNVGALLEAVADRPGLELTVAGEGPEEAQLRQLAERLGVADRVRFIAHYPVDEHLGRMRELLLRSEVLCLPSTSESFGLVMIEALACGTPVVGFGPAMAELEQRVGIRCGERLSAADGTEIAAALDRAMTADWDRVALSDRVRAAYAPSHAARAYAEVIHDLADDRRAALVSG